MMKTLRYLSLSLLLPLLVSSVPVELNDEVYGWPSISDVLSAKDMLEKALAQTLDQHEDIENRGLRRKEAHKLFTDFEHEIRPRSYNSDIFRLNKKSGVLGESNVDKRLLSPGGQKMMPFGMLRLDKRSQLPAIGSWLRLDKREVRSLSDFYNNVLRLDRRDGFGQKPSLGFLRLD